MKKSLLFATLTTIMTFGISMTAFAGYEYTGCKDIDGNYAERLGYWRKMPLDGGGYMRMEPI